MKYILNYEYEEFPVFNHEKQMNESNLAQWAVLKNEAGEEVGYLQPNCGSYAEFTDLKVELSEEEKESILEEATEHFEKQEKDWQTETEIEEIKGRIYFEEIETKRQKILEILNENDTDPDKHLILTDDLYRSKSISILDAMVNLQIVLGCSQKQSREIVALFV
ncbi:MAG: hypothetical protein WDA37_11750 [Dysgonamonadaceae bacterium]